MATLKIEIDDASLAIDDRLTNLDEVIDEMLEAAGKLVKASWESHTKSFGHYKEKKRSYGDMYDNIEASMTKRKTDAYRSIQVYPRRSITRRLKNGNTQKITNAQKAFYLNYGTTVRGKTHVLGDRWVEWTRSDSDPQAIAEMEKIWAKYNQKYS